MGAIANQAQGRSLQTLDPKKQLRTVLERSWGRIAAVMPREMDAHRLYQMCVSTINREPELANCSVESVLSCFMQCTSLGLEPSNVNGLGHAYILPYGNKRLKNGQKQATFIIGYKGMIKLLENSGMYAQPRAVYEDDGIKLKLDENGIPIIVVPDEVNVDADHSEDKLKFVYLSVTLPNGNRYADYMSRKDCLAYRDKYAPRGKYDNEITGPWRDNFVEMSMKTLIRRSFKYLPVSVEAKKAVVVDETTPDYSDIFHPVLEQSESERVDAMNAPAEAHADVYVTETNETNETEPADWAEQAADETAEKEQQQ